MNAVKVVPPLSGNAQLSGGYIEINNGGSRDMGVGGAQKQSISIINSNIYGMQFHQDEYGRKPQKQNRAISSSQLYSDSSKLKLSLRNINSHKALPPIGQSRVDKPASSKRGRNDE